VRPGVAESQQVELDAGPVAVVVIVGPVEAGRVRGLTPVRALQGCNQQESHGNE
jgi:hypothetical protein